LNAVEEGVTVPDIAEPVLTLDDTVKLEDRAIFGSVIVWLTVIVPTEDPRYVPFITNAPEILQVAVPSLLCVIVAVFVASVVVVVVEPP
jgi:uncharacterized membrane protein